MHIQIKKGLDIPILGVPKGHLQTLGPAKKVSLNLDPFDDLRFRLLVREGENVKIGQPLLEDKSMPGRHFVSPGAGKIIEIRRGLKRRLIDIVIETVENEDYFDHNLNQDLISILKSAGLFANIRVRPFNRLANPDKLPSSIFVKALESAPFTPPSEFQVEGFEDDFQRGLTALATLAPVHLIYRKDTVCKAFTQAKDVQKHTAEGPHPIANVSVHIQFLDPIKNADDTKWTLNAHTVVSIGHLLKTGKTHIEKIISIAGPGFLENKVGYFKARQGYPLTSLIEGRIKNESVRLISGDPLMGQKVIPTDFLHYDDFVVCAFPETNTRETLHFFRLGKDKYSFSKAYLSGHSRSGKLFDFDTNLHGEHRPFIDGSLYDKVMPLNISTMTLVKAALAEDYERAEELGLIEVDSEDFALPTFVCPSKIEMVDIIKQALRNHASEIL